MSGNKAIGYHYDKSLRALIDPAHAGGFFRHYRPRTEAAWCAEISRLAYCRDQSLLVSSLEYAGFELVAAFDQAGTEGFLARGTALSVLAFRGSDDLRAWITNLDIRPAPWRGGGNAHRGFAEALDRVWPEAEASVAQAGTPLLFTGHSLGAALATLAASLVPKAVLITFGSPRVGDTGFCAAMRRRPGEAKRFVNNRDIVCRVPSARLGYRHVGEPWLITADGSVTQHSPPSHGLAALLRDGLSNGSAWRRGDLPRELTDHSPINYVMALR